MIPRLSGNQLCGTRTAWKEPARQSATARPPAQRLIGGCFGSGGQTGAPNLCWWQAFEALLAIRVIRRTEQNGMAQAGGKPRSIQAGRRAGPADAFDLLRDGHQKDPWTESPRRIFIAGTWATSSGHAVYTLWWRAIPPRAINC